MSRGGSDRERKPDLGFVHRYETGSELTTLLLLHGTGGDENDLLALGRLVAPGAGLLSPRGRVLEHGMPRFFRRLGPGVFDVEDLTAQAHDLAGFVEGAARDYKFRLDRTIAVGYSNGANIAAAILFLRPGLISAAALLHAMVPFAPEKLPDLRSTEVLVTAGRHDPMVPADEAERLAVLLREAGANVVLEWQSGGHELGRDEVATVQKWLTQISTR
jgi:phospholipase/carboxylesterase